MNEKKPIASLSAKMLQAEPKMAVELEQDGDVMALITLIAATVLTVAKKSNTDAKVILMGVAASMDSLDKTPKTEFDLGKMFGHKNKPEA